jgi:hypothetical protein
VNNAVGAITSSLPDALGTIVIREDALHNEPNLNVQEQLLQDLVVRKKMPNAIKSNLTTTTNDVISTRALQVVPKDSDLACKQWILHENRVVCIRS